MVDGGSAKVAVPPLTLVPPLDWLAPVPLLPLLPQAAAVIAMAAAPQAAASTTRARRRRPDGNAPIVRSSLLCVVKNWRAHRLLHRNPLIAWRVDPPTARAPVTGYTSIMTDGEQARVNKRQRSCRAVFFRGDDPPYPPLSGASQRGA